jgi:hypothetical protein
MVRRYVYVKGCRHAAIDGEERQRDYHEQEKKEERGI